MKEQSLVCCLSVILYIYAKLGRKRPRFNIFASITKHVCILNKACLQAKTPSLEDCKHAIYEA